MVRQISPDRVFEEVRDFGMKLNQGLRTLGELGDVEVGASAKEAIYEEDKLVLYRFRPQAKVTNPIPVLIVYALVNRPYMLDLQEDRSIIRSLLRGGLDVYLVDWGYPDSADRYLTLDDYINGYIDRCVDVIRDRHGLDAINLMGVCQGGTFSLCYSALHPEENPEPHHDRDPGRLSCRHQPAEPVGPARGRRSGGRHAGQHSG